jgi:signal transduction histidine kinase/ActR/RegA family two-component response regulator
VLEAFARVAAQRNVQVAAAAGALSILGSSLTLASHSPLFASLAAGSAMVALIAGGLAVIQISSRRGALRQLKDAIEPMAEGIAFFDADDCATVWNPRYAELVDPAGALRPGVSFKDLLVESLRAGVHPEAKGREAEWLEERLSNRGRLGSDEHQNGDRWVRAERRRTPDGGLVTVCVDVTDFRRATEVLAQARDAAEAANRAKSEFLANVSHELRTPLNGVMGIAEVLAKTELNPRQKEMVDTIRSSGETLAELVSDIIDLARLESSKITVAQDEFNLAQTINTAATPYRLQAAKKKIGFSVVITPDVEERVHGDAVRLRQILGNLMSNAVKFTDKGEVRIMVDRPDPSRPLMRFRVQDTGVGFDDALKSRLFERFHQGDGSSTRRHGGTGLGLAISRQAATLLGGDLDCESVPGRGAVFTLTLNLPPGEAAAAPAEPLSENPSSHEEGHALRVLVVDDHPTNRRVVEMILDQVGAERVSVQNGQEALEAYLNDRFDVVLMDIQMPVMDGLTATRTIRLHERECDRPATPVIILSANALPEHIEAGRAAGADRHLAKPISAAALLHAIAEVANENASRAA